MKRLLTVILSIALATLLVSHRAAAESRPLAIDKANTSVAVLVESTMHDFTSAVTSFDLNIQVDNESGDIVAAEFVFNFADMDSENAKRDRTMLKWLSHRDYPIGTFSTTSISLEKDQWMAEGRLSIHGLTKTLRFPFDLRNEGGKITIDANTVIDYQDWDLEIIKVMGFIKVAPELEIRIHVEGR